MSLFLNNGSVSNPPVVVLLSPGMVDEQLNRACQAFVDHTVQVSTWQRCGRLIMSRAQVLWW